MKNGTKNILALGVGLVLAFVLAEAALRVHQRVTRGTPLFSLLPGYRPSARFPLSPFLVFGPRTSEQLEGKRHPEWSFYNHQGLRTRDTLRADHHGEFRIFAIGGSTTVDLENDEGIHWPLAAEQALHRAGRGDVRIYNAAMSAYTSAHSLVRLSLDLLQYRPDMVLVMDHVNDLSVSYHAWRAGEPVDANYLVKYGRREATGVVAESDLVFSRVLHSAGARLADLVARPPAEPAAPAAIEPGRALFQRNLASQIAVAREHGVAIVLITMPMASSDSVYEATRRAGGDARVFPAFAAFRRDFDSFNDAIREVGAREGVPVIDAARLVPGDAAHFVDVVHHSESGVRALGDAVAAQLLRQLATRPVAEGSVR